MDFEFDLTEARQRWLESLAEKREACVNAKEDKFADVVAKYLFALSSEQRVDEMVSLLRLASPKNIWKVFLENWNMCDDTWKRNKSLLKLLWKAAGATNPTSYYSDQQRAFFERLPEVVTVYRGCSRQRIAGISWTTDISIASCFASGHRQIRVHDPVIVTAEVHKKSILAVFTDRGESEIVCSPARIVKVDKYKA